MLVVTVVVDGVNVRVVVKVFGVRVMVVVEVDVMGELVAVTQGGDVVDVKTTVVVTAGGEMVLQIALCVVDMVLVNVLKRLVQLAFGSYRNRTILYS